MKNSYATENLKNKAVWNLKHYFEGITNSHFNKAYPFWSSYIVSSVTLSHFRQYLIPNASMGRFMPARLT